MLEFLRISAFSLGFAANIHIKIPDAGGSYVWRIFIKMKALRAFHLIHAFYLCIFSEVMRPM